MYCYGKISAGDIDFKLEKAKEMTLEKQGNR